MDIVKARSRSVVAAMLCAAAVTAQFVSGKAARDALFLTSLDFTALPAMLIATSACLDPAGRRQLPGPPAAIATGDAGAGLLRRPAACCSWSSGCSDPRRRSRPPSPSTSTSPARARCWRRVLADRERALRPAHREKAVRPDCRRRHAGRPGERAAGRARRGHVRRPGDAAAARRCCSSAAPGSSARPRSSRRRRPGRGRLTTTSPARAARVRHCACLPRRRTCAISRALVLLGTTGAALVDYLFKAQAVETFGRGDNLLRFFALYYAGDQPDHVRRCRRRRAALVLERFGLGVTAEHAVGRAARRQPRRPRRARASAACSSRAAANRCSAARCSAPATSCSTRRFRPTRSAPPSRSSTSASTVSATRVGGGLVRAGVLLAAGVAVLGDPVARHRLLGGRDLAASRLNRGYIGTLENSLVDPRRGGRRSVDAKTTRQRIRPRWLRGDRRAQPSTSHAARRRPVRRARDRSARRSNPRCATSSACARATATASSRCCRGRTG